MTNTRQQVRLTEARLHSIIRETIVNVLKEAQGDTPEGEHDLFYTIFVTESYGAGTIYRVLTDHKYESYLNRDGNYRYRKVPSDLHLQETGRSPYYPAWNECVLKFKTAEEAVEYAKKLQQQGVLDKRLPIKVGETSSFYRGERKVISILQCPLGYYIGHRYADYLSKTKDNPEAQAKVPPKFKAGDIVYLTTIEDGDIIYKTKVFDCEVDKDGKWNYFTTYWSQYPYTEHDLLTQEEFDRYYTKSKDYPDIVYTKQTEQRRRVVER